MIRPRNFVVAMLVAALMIFTLAGLPGCKEGQPLPPEVVDAAQVICSPTAEQVAAWGQEILSGTDLLSFLELVPQTAAIMGIVNVVKAGINVLEKARQGICTRLTEIEAAKAAIQTEQAKATLKYGYKPRPKK